MTSWKRITFVVFVLIGGTMSFSYWSFNQFNSTLNDLETVLTANMLLVSSSLELSFNFPKKDDEVYIGCTYPISWQSSTIINSLGTVLVDAGAGESTDPIASGLVKESVIETNSQNLNWKVGVVRPGEYYIKALKINGADVEIRSEVFTINNMPKGINTTEQGKICKGSGGL